MQKFLRMTMLFALMAFSISALAFELDFSSDERAMSAFRNSEDCSFYALATEKTRAAEAAMRADRARLSGLAAGAEASLRACVEAAGINYDTAEERDIFATCRLPYDKMIFTGVQLRLVNDELVKLSALSEDISIATESRCGLPKAER